MCNYWLIPMNFQVCSLAHLLDEYKTSDNKEIWWQAPPQHLTKDAKEDIPAKEGSIAKKLAPGDIVYFYVTNLPTANNNALSRILLRGKIYTEAFVKQKKLVWPDASENEKINAFSIGELVTLNKNYLENNSILRLESETETIEDKKKKYHYYLRLSKDEKCDFIYPQGWTKWPNNAAGSFSLGKKIFDYFEDGEDFNALISHFNNRKCYFCNKSFHGTTWEECEHKTFIGRNGLNYYEYHHFILQKIADKTTILKGIVESPSNGLCLCSNCHNRFHYGTPEDIKEMIDIVLEDSSVLDDAAKQTIVESVKSISEGEKTISQWLLDEYLSR